MKAREDISRAEYLKKMRAYGFERVGFHGYWNLPGELKSVSVSDLNAGPSFRRKLAYMLDAVKRHQAQADAQTQRDQLMAKMAAHLFVIACAHQPVAGWPENIRAIPTDLAGKSFRIGEFKITITMPDK